jgi:hypothetical protein
VARVSLFGIMCVGSLMIVAMSSWLNAAALAGSAAIEQHLANTQEGYTADLDQAHSNALSALSLLPDIQRAAERFARLAEEERSSGALTGSLGHRLGRPASLTQMSAQMRELEATIQGNRETVRSLFEEGQAHLATMRGLVSGSGPVAPRADSFGEEAVALSGVIAALEQTSIAPSVARAAQDLSAGFIAPVADGRSADLMGRQDQVMATIRESVAAQSAALSEAAAEIMAQPPVAERRYVPLSAAEAVLKYATSFLPSWAGAISIDLLPGVLVAIMGVVHATIRRNEEGLHDAERMTAADLLRSLGSARDHRRDDRPPVAHGAGPARARTEPRCPPAHPPRRLPRRRPARHAGKRHAAVAGRQEEARSMTASSESSEPKERGRLAALFRPLRRWRTHALVVSRASGRRDRRAGARPRRHGRAQWRIWPMEASLEEAPSDARPSCRRRSMTEGHAGAIHGSARACNQRRSELLRGPMRFELLSEGRDAGRGQHRTGRGRALCRRDRATGRICQDPAPQFAGRLAR